MSDINKLKFVRQVKREMDASNRPFTKWIYSLLSPPHHS
jgi:hypothetical protein